VRLGPAGSKTWDVIMESSEAAVKHAATYTEASSDYPGTAQLWMAHELPDEALKETKSSSSWCGPRAICFRAFITE
jgi:hypothetical protein